MTINQKTLLLDQDAWDLVLDANGDIASANAPYSVAQDVASAVRTFKGECWYDNSLGVPYWSDVLGKNPAYPYLKQQFTDAAFTIPNVQQANVVFTNFSDRVLTGQVQVIDTDGFESGVTFGESP